MYGVHPAHRFYRIYGKHLSKKVGNADITFSQVDTRPAPTCPSVSVSK